MTLTVTLAAPRDAQAISRFAHSSFVHTFAHLYDPKDLAAFLAIWNQSDDLAHQAQSDEWGLALIRDEAGEILGFVKTGPLDLPLPADQPSENATELHQLYVHERAKGTGVAAALMDFALTWAKRRAEILYLSVYSENPRAQRFYARYGFVDVARNPFLVGNHIDEDRIWRLNL
jgi:ribosomal protein S18 acetylase RimI-like enzyme